MLDYRSQGILPDKPHTVFPKEDGSSYFEHCFTQDGFDGPFSILYHESEPQRFAHGESVEALWAPRIEVPKGEEEALRRRHFQSQKAKQGGSSTCGRQPYMFNSDLTVGVVRPDATDDYYFANGDGDDVFYIHRGGGELVSWFGRLKFKQGDYLMIPRSVAHRIIPDDTDQYWLWIECRRGLRIPKQYRNPLGQLRMDAPYTHRDFDAPELDGPIDPEGPKRVITKKRDRFTQHAYATAPMDTVGWDGTVYPVIFPILQFSPKAGQVHLPPTVHGTFATPGSLICSFVPRMVDFGEGAIPCPYPHSSVDVDEVIFYCDGDFTSRRGLGAGSISFHPSGVPHGPHPGAYEASVGVRQVEEIAVMIDTFESFRLTAAGRNVEDPHYDESWKG